MQITVFLFILCIAIDHAFTYAPILNYLVVVHASDWKLELSWSG